MEVIRGIFVLRLKLDVSGENVMQMMEMDIGQREREENIGWKYRGTLCMSVLRQRKL